MTILTVNTGSSSVRVALFDELDPPRRIEQRHIERPTKADNDDIRGMLREVVADRAVRCVVHRVVHGGASLTEPCIIDERIEAEIDRLSALAPLHNPRALAWLRASRQVVGAQAVQIAVFDTGFFAGMPQVARRYAIPRELADKYRIRRYGFHGLAHQAMWRRWQALRKTEDADRLISLQLGSGCSIAAIAAGEPKDTSMGFTPVEGLMMATRSGDIDAGLVAYLQQHERLSPKQMEDMLNRQSGLLGIAAESDMQRLLSRNDQEARLAVDMYCYRARKYIGAYLASLGGADAIVFGGGVGEHAAVIRQRILADMQWAGIRLDEEANSAAFRSVERGTDARISRSDSDVDVWVLNVDEQLELAYAARATPRHPG